MSSTNRTPDFNEQFITPTGKAVERFYRWCQMVTSDIDKLNTADTYYNDLADINEKISRPTRGQKAMVAGQGLAVYNSINWVLAADDSTPIT